MRLTLLTTKLSGMWEEALPPLCIEGALGKRTAGDRGDIASMGTKYAHDLPLGV